MKSVDLKLNLKDELHDYVMIAIAMLIACTGWVIFLLPNQITTGGVPGISSVLLWGLGIDVKVTYVVVNTTLLVLALKILGLKFCVKTIWAVITFTFFTGVLQDIFGVPAPEEAFLHDQKFMAAVVGGAFLGAGVGLGLASNGSTGGSDVIAAMINKYKDVSLGRLLLMTDIGVVTSVRLVLPSWEDVMYGYIVLVMSAICVDGVVNASRRSVQFVIISDKYEEIAEAISKQIRRGVTIINSQGYYTGTQLKMLFVLARQTESTNIFRLIKLIDREAFVSQSSVIGVYGKGFDKFKGSDKEKIEKAIKDRDKKPSLA